MPKTATPLTNTEVKSAKPKDKIYYLADGKGLQLKVATNGTKSWLFTYTHPFNKKRLTMSFGVYPEVSLAQARLYRTESRELLSRDVDPKAHRDELAIAEQTKHENTLERVFRDYMETQLDTLNERTIERNVRAMEMHVFPHLGQYPIHLLTAPNTIAVLKPLEAEGKRESVKRICQILNRVMVFALNSGIIEHNKLEGIKAAFKPPVVTSMPSISPERLPEFMHAVAKSKMTLITRFCFEWQLHTMVRASEAAKVTWDEIDLENKIWVIPEGRMKMNRVHKVPLSDYLILLLMKLKEISGHRPYLFPSRNDPMEHIGAETVNKALKDTEFGKEIVSHGFRALASTALNEEGFESDLIEANLAHADKNQIRWVYNRADYIERRRPIMNWWSNFIQQASVGDLCLVGSRESFIANP